MSQRGKPGRPAIAEEVRKPIRDMWEANPTWGSPRIVGEQRKVGIEVTKSTVEKYRMRPPKPPSPTWKTFLANHVQDLVALDFFVVPTVTCKVLFVLLILAHHRRRSSILTSLSIPRQSGRRSRSLRPSRGTRPRGISCATGTESMALPVASGYSIWGSKRS